MYRRVLISLIIVALTLSVGVAPAAARAETYHFSTKGLSAYATFYGFDETGCVESYADLSATDGRVKQTGKPAVVSEMFIYLYQYDYCTGEWLLDGFGYASLAPADFVINKKADAAALHTTINVYNYVTDSELPVTIDVTWTGAGSAYQEKYHAQYRSPEFRYNYRFMGLFRDAEATGSISAAGIGFGLQPAEYAQLASVKSGEVDIIK